MTLMSGNESGIIIILILVALLWIIPITMLIVGLVRLKNHPKSAKILLIISGVWLTIGIGICGSMML